MREQIQWKTEKQTQDKNGESTNKSSCIISFMNLWLYYLFKSKISKQQQQKSIISLPFFNPPIATSGFQNEIHILPHGLSCITGFYFYRFQTFPLLSFSHTDDLLLILFHRFQNMVLQNFLQLSLNILLQKALSITSLRYFLPSYCLFLPQPIITIIISSITLLTQMSFSSFIEM